MPSLEEILQRTTDLPSIPAAALAVLREAESSSSSAHTIAAKLAADQGLAVRVLRLANSAFYGLPRQVMSVQEAVVVLGTRTIRHLCLVAATYPWLSKPLPGYELGPEQLFIHALAVATGSELIADQTSKIQRDDAFTVGLLHNLGKVALSAWLENKLQGVQTIAEYEKLAFDQAERRIFGYDHAEIGAALADRWNLPKTLVLAIRYHHKPQDNGAPRPLVDAIHVGDFLAMSLGFGVGGDGLQYEFDVTSLDRLGLTSRDLDDLANRLLDAVEHRKQMFQQNIATAA